MLLQTTGFFPIIRINNLKKRIHEESRSSQQCDNKQVPYKFTKPKIFNNFTLKPLNFPKKCKELNSLQPSFFNLEKKIFMEFS